MEYWGDVMDDTANWLSGAKAAAGKDGQASSLRPHALVA